MAADPFQPADASSYTPQLLGYRVEVYDLISRTPAKDADGNLRNWDATGSSSTSSAIDAIAPTGSRLVTHSTLDATKTECTIDGLKNGKHYVPIIKTVTLQGTDTVTSAGRTIYDTIGTATDEVEMHTVDVDYTDAVGGTAYTAIRFRNVQPTTGTVGANVTSTYFKSSGNDKTTVVPFGAPIITVDLASTPKTLKVDDNGRNLLFGAMLQTAPGTNNAMPDGTNPQRIGGAMTTSAGMDNVFYLDLSFGANYYGNASSASTQNPTFDANSVVTYESPAGAADAGVTYPARDVTNVNTAYLGSNWASETNYIFASNAAGTTVGKIDGTGLTLQTQ
jgi:hypothetical protein